MLLGEAPEICSLTCRGDLTDTADEYKRIYLLRMLRGSFRLVSLG